MEIKNHIFQAQTANNQTSLADLVKKLEETCKECTPLTLTTCLAGCKSWKLKNQLRTIREKTRRPDFTKKLLNVLKNQRRLQLLEMISNERHPIVHLQQKLKQLGFEHSQQTILQQYLIPLAEVGLAEKDHDSYFATIFGQKINELAKSHDLISILPPHSDCYEEKTLNVLLEGSKTHEDLRNVAPAESMARILFRLQKALLVEKSGARDYVFFFKTRRNPNSSRLSPAEQRIYENITTEGISASKLSEKAKVSLRRTYKYLRKLKGKKLVFARKKPISFTLTDRGVKIALTLEAVNALTSEMHTAMEQLAREKEIVPLATVQNIECNPQF